MFDRLADLETELEKLESQLSELYASGDQQAAAAAGRRLAELKPVVDAYRQYRTTEDELAEARELLAGEDDAEMREYLDARSAAKDAELAALDAKLRELLVPRDPDDGKNVIVEIRGGEGGEEGNLWAADLFHMYQRYADVHRWKVEVLNSQPSDMGGFREITFVVKGDDAWSRLKHEAGPHRVQRVPVTESQGRVHTSAATVTVLPEAEEIDVGHRSQRPRDRRVPVERPGRSVGEHHRLRRAHHPQAHRASSSPARTRRASCRTRTRRCASCAAVCSRSNVSARSRSCRRRAASQVKSGGRSDKIRTYNYKENRVTDHRIGLTLHSLDQVLAGQLDDITDALIADERAVSSSGDEPGA